MTILLFFAFLAGFVTILAPCIWPLLPIVLSASAGAGKRRPLGITLGVMTSFTVFTLSISYLEKIFHLDPNVFRLLAVIVIGLLGVSMIIPSLGARFEVFINDLLRPFQNKLNVKGSGLGAGYATGFSIGLVWAPCAGPILATVATLAATQAVDIRVVFVTLAYVSGLGIPLFFLSLAGSTWFSRMRKINKYTGVVQQIFGLVMIVAAALIYTNYDKTIQVKILNYFPSYGKIFNNIENNEQVAKQLQVLRGEKDLPAQAYHNVGDLPDLGMAPEIVGITHWLNTSAPLTLADLKGKVVLIDFWTYSCINCVRTLPYVTGWYEKYKDSGFVVIGVHAPEFAFEKDTRNVEKALKQFKINFPVAQDNDFATWKNYKNHYWPAKYLIDANGHLRYTHFGEGNYDETEMLIRKLLIEAGQKVGAGLSAVKEQAGDYEKTPETYLGAGRIERFDSPQGVQTGGAVFTKPSTIALDHFAYEGTWDLDDEKASATAGAALELHFQAGKVFLVIGPAKQGDQVQVLLDGKVVSAQQAGQDVKDGIVIVDSERLYELIDLRGKAGQHVLRLNFLNNGIAVYAFTFG
jgi:cytochrome c biogenesis protein CcdA/thiol-disulfide isomerase/thioredoxin